VCVGRAFESQAGEAGIRVWEAGSWQTAGDPLPGHKMTVTQLVRGGVFVFVCVCVCARARVCVHVCVRACDLPKTPATAANSRFQHRSQILVKHWSNAGCVLPRSPATAGNSRARRERGTWTLRGGMFDQASHAADDQYLISVLTSKKECLRKRGAHR
jgi:hypothetical protein